MPAAIDGVVARAMAKNPDYRYQSEAEPSDPNIRQGGHHVHQIDSRPNRDLHDGGDRGTGRAVERGTPGVGRPDRVDVSATDNAGSLPVNVTIG